MHLNDNMDWVLRPVAKGMCKYESLKDGTLDLADIALMNDMIDLETENNNRYAEWVKANPNG